MHKNSCEEKITRDKYRDERDELTRLKDDYDSLQIEKNLLDVKVKNQNKSYENQIEVLANENKRISNEILELKKVIESQTDKEQRNKQKFLEYKMFQRRYERASEQCKTLHEQLNFEKSFMQEKYCTVVSQ